MATGAALCADGAGLSSIARFHAPQTCLAAALQNVPNQQPCIVGTTNQSMFLLTTHTWSLRRASVARHPWLLLHRLSIDTGTVTVISFVSFLAPAMLLHTIAFYLGTCGLTGSTSAESSCDDIALPRNCCKSSTRHSTMSHHGMMLKDQQQKEILGKFVQPPACAHTAGSTLQSNGAATQLRTKQQLGAERKAVYTVLVCHADMSSRFCVMNPHANRPCCQCP